jgi:hypothetical protein
LDPPQHAAVFCVDEKTAIQALDRLDPVLPLSPGRAERHGFEYYRHGTLSLYAALEVRTGKVEGKTAKRHISAEFVVFLGELVKKARWAKQIHIVLDNLSAHKTKAVEKFLEQNPKVRFHFTPVLFVLAKSGGAVVREDPTRRHRQGRFHLRCRSRPQTAEIHSSLRDIGETVSLDLYRSPQTHSYSIRPSNVEIAQAKVVPAQRPNRPDS